MTPEQREDARVKAQRIVNAGGTENADYAVAVGFLSLIAQVEALTLRTERAERALVRGGFVDNGAQEWKPPLGPAPKFIEVEALTVPQIVAFGCTLIGHASTTDGMDDKEATAWVSQQWEEWSSPTIPAIPGTKEGA